MQFFSSFYSSWTVLSESLNNSRNRIESLGQLWSGHISQLGFKNYIYEDLVCKKKFHINSVDAKMKNVLAEFRLCYKPLILNKITFCLSEEL